MSQSPSGRSCSHTGYPSTAWWAVTPANYLMGRKLIQWWPKPFVARHQPATTCGISPDFSGLSPATG